MRFNEGVLIGFHTTEYLPMPDELDPPPLASASIAANVVSVRIRLISFLAFSTTISLSPSMNKYNLRSPGPGCLPGEKNVPRVVMAAPEISVI